MNFCNFFVNKINFKVEVAHVFEKINSCKTCQWAIFAHGRAHVLPENRVNDVTATLIIWKTLYECTCTDKWHGTYIIVSKPKYDIAWYILYMYQKYEMVYTLVYVCILINEISLTGLLFWNIIVHVIVNVQFMAQRERENLNFKKQSYCYISFTYLSVIGFFNMFYGASKYSSRWGNSDLILFHLMICMIFLEIVSSMDIFSLTIVFLGSI